MTQQCLYRFEDYLSGDEYSVEVRIQLCEYPVVRTTPCGAWIDDYGRKRFVLSGARKRYACATVDEARESFIRRKQRQLSIYQSRVQYAERALEIARDNIMKDVV